MKIKVWGKYKILVCKDSSKIEMALVALLREKITELGGWLP